MPEDPKTLDFTQDSLESVEKDPLRPTSVSETDIFRLAKNILLISFVLYLIVLILFAFSTQFCIKEPMKEVWAFSSQGIFGIINLIIGFYFGGKIKNKI